MSSSHSQYTIVKPIVQYSYNINDPKLIIMMTIYIVLYISPL